MYGAEIIVYPNPVPSGGYGYMDIYVFKYQWYKNPKANLNNNIDTKRLTIIIRPSI